MPGHAYLSLLLLALTVATHPAVAAEQTLETLEVRSVTAPELRLFDGTVEAVNRATVSAQTSGRIVEVGFDVDDYVEKGQIIVRFKDTDQRAGQQAAAAALAEAEARLREAEIEHRRVTDLLARQLISKSDFDRAEAGFAAAKARVDAAQARLKAADEELENTRVRAPYAGIVIERHAEVGELANRGQPLMSGIALDRLRIVSHLPQSLILNRGSALEVRIGRHGGDATLAPEQVRLHPYADPRTQTVTARMTLPRGDHGLLPGMSVKVAVVVGTAERLRVPVRALVQRRAVAGVYVVDEAGEAHLRQVRLGRQRGDEIELVAGIRAGERIALDPIAAGVYLKDRAQGGAK